jgi:hypothetical protein
VQQAVEKLVVSHRLSKRMRGNLHAGTNYSKAFKPKDGNGQAIPSSEGTHRVRRPLVALKASEIENIADVGVKTVVIAALEKAGGEEPKKVFANAANLPRIKDKFGNEHVINKVRINVSVNPFAMGRHERQRLVDSTQGSNHHAEVWTGVDVKGRPTAELVIVTLRDAKKHVPTAPTLGMKLGYTLCGGEHVELSVDNRHLVCKVLGITEGEIECVEHCDGRPGPERKKQGDRIRLSGASFKGNGKTRVLRKVLITPLGDVLPAND